VASASFYRNLSTFALIVSSHRFHPPSSPVFFPPMCPPGCLHFVPQLSLGVTLFSIFFPTLNSPFLCCAPRTIFHVLSMCSTRFEPHNLSPCFCILSPHLEGTKQFPPFSDHLRGSPEIPLLFFPHQFSYSIELNLPCARLIWRFHSSLSPFLFYPLTNMTQSPQTPSLCFTSLWIPQVSFLYFVSDFPNGLSFFLSPFIGSSDIFFPQYPPPL